MRVLLVDVPVRLEQALSRALGGRHEVNRLADVRNEESCARSATCEVVVHGSCPTDGVTAIDLATRGTWNLITTTSARRYVRLSTMRLFDAYSPLWAVDEHWMPRPTSEPDLLAHHLAELTSRELSRVVQLECLVLRLGVEPGADPLNMRRPRRFSISFEAIVRTIVEAIESDFPETRSGSWRVAHVLGDVQLAGLTSHTAAASDPSVSLAPSPLGGAEDVAAASIQARTGPAINTPKPTDVTLFGAGGPLGAVSSRALAMGHRVLLTDARSLRECADAPQSEGAPLPEPPSGRQRERVVDVTDAEAVHRAANGAQCLVNCAVVRSGSDDAFAVNVIGAWNVMQAAIAHSIGRVIHTGPAQVLAPYPVGYAGDRRIDESAPARPGNNLYYLTKYLGQEICRILAEEVRIACPVLLFTGLVNPAVPRRRPLHPFSVSWNDAGRAIAAAVDVVRLPEPCPVMHIHVDSPHDRYRPSSAKSILGWEPTDRLDRFWYAPTDGSMDRRFAEEMERQ